MHKNNKKICKAKKYLYICNPIFKRNAEIAQLVEHNLAKVGVASSSLVFRSTINQTASSKFEAVFIFKIRLLASLLGRHQNCLPRAAQAKPQPLSRLLKTQEEDWRRHSRRPIPLQYRVRGDTVTHCNYLQCHNSINALKRKIILSYCHYQSVLYFVRYFYFL